MPEDEGEFSGVRRDLIEDVGVIAVQRLARGVGVGGVVGTLLDGVERAGSGDDRPADCEAALLLDHQRLGLTLFCFLRTCRSKKDGRRQPERD